MATILFGIPNCDTVQKARKWLDQHRIPYQFHDFRKDGLSAKQLDHWCQLLGWETLINRRGTTWRKLPESERVAIDARSAQVLMLAQPTLIKRPVLQMGEIFEVGFDADRYQTLFN